MTLVAAPPGTKKQVAPRSAARPAGKRPRLAKTPPRHTSTDDNGLLVKAMVPPEGEGTLATDWSLRLRQRKEKSGTQWLVIEDFWYWLMSCLYHFDWFLSFLHSEFGSYTVRMYVAAIFRGSTAPNEGSVKGSRPPHSLRLLPSKKY